MKPDLLIPRLLRAVLPLVLLVACTGTTSLQAPRLLIVTYGSGTDGSVALIRENGPSGTSTPPRLEFLAGTVIPLAGQAVAADLADRTGARAELVLLIERSAGQYALAFFNTDDLNPLDPTGFQRSSPDLELAPLLADAAVDPGAICLTALQVSADARFVALLNGGGACPAGISDAPELFVVDRDENSVASLSKSRDLLPVRPYLNQEFSSDSAEGRLFYLVGAPSGNAELWSTSLPLAEGAAADGETESVFSSGSSSPLRDLAESAAGLLALRRDSIDVLPPEGNVRPLATRPVATQFVRDPYGTDLTQILVLHDGPDAGLSVHRSDVDAAPANAKASSVSSATVDPERLYVYLLQAGGIRIVDLYDLIDEPSLKVLEPRWFPLADLAGSTPGLITWVPAALPAP